MFSDAFHPLTHLLANNHTIDCNYLEHSAGLIIENEVVFFLKTISCIPTISFH